MKSSSARTLPRCVIPRAREFNKEMIATARKGSGWVDYQWAHPVTKKVEDKTCYIVKIDQPEGFVAVGIFR
jgi:cytochrome c